MGSIGAGVWGSRRRWVCGEETGPISVMFQFLNPSNDKEVGIFFLR